MATTLRAIIEKSKCRKGKAAGTTKKGAYWIAAAIPTRSFGGDGIGCNAADQEYILELRHFRDGQTQPVLHYDSWHQNIGKIHKYTPAPKLLDLTTIEQIIVALKGIRADNGWCMEAVYSDRKEEKFTATLVALGMAEMEPAPDEDDPETAA